MTRDQMKKKHNKEPPPPKPIQLPFLSHALTHQTQQEMKS